MKHAKPIWSQKENVPSPLDSKEVSAQSYRTQGINNHVDMRLAKGEIEVADQAHLPSSKKMTLLVSADVSTRVFVMADRPPVKSGPQPVTSTWVHFTMKYMWNRVKS